MSSFLVSVYFSLWLVMFYEAHLICYDLACDLNNWGKPGINGKQESSQGRQALGGGQSEEIDMGPCVGQ
jgi:hypothetical protein